MENLAKEFKALAVHRRLKIIEMLYCCEKCACDLEETLDLSQSGLSYHMKILIEANLVSARSEGKWMHYQLSNTGFEQVKTFLDSVHELK